MDELNGELINELLSKLLATSYSLLETGHKLTNPESLPVVATADNSVEVARKTLRWLRNLQDISLDMENWMYISNLPEQQNKAQLLQNLITLYAGQVKIAQLSNPDLLNHFTIEHANHAAGSIALSISLHTLECLPDESPFIAPLDSQLEDIPTEWDSRQELSVETLIDAIESGLTHLMNKPLGDRSPVDRLLELSQNLQEAVRQLYSIDTLEDPAREESVELAREILRKLKNMSFSDKPIEEAINTGRPNEKLAFAQRISEMVDMYKNLLSEAIRNNPEIINDVRVMQATDAAGDCATSVKLMASKEIPTSSTALHQISADLKAVGGGKKFHSASLNKLMHKMEGGMEQAIDENSSGKKQSSHNAAEAEAVMLADRVRRRRRQKQQNHNIASNPNAAKRANMVNQHHVVMSTLKGEERPAGLNNVDIAAVRQAGNSLRKSNKQAFDMVAQNKNVTKNMYGIPMTSTPKTVTPAAPVSPDDKGFANRERDPLNPNHPNHPRNNRPRIG